MLRPAIKAFSSNRWKRNFDCLSSYTLTQNPFHNKCDVFKNSRSIFLFLEMKDYQKKLNYISVHIMTGGFDNDET
jgi:hypothetical protein